MEFNTFKKINIIVFFSELTNRSQFAPHPLPVLPPAYLWFLGGPFRYHNLHLTVVLCFDSVDVRFDPFSAHRRLIISPDGKTVADGEENHKVPSSPERFDSLASVMGLNLLTSGKAYWEVDLHGKTGWDLGVARRDANRKGKLSLAPSGGYWVLVHCEGYYAAMSTPVIHLSLTGKPQRVGVFVDFEQSLVSFFDVAQKSHIYSFTKCTFRGSGIVPYFSPHLKQGNENSEPLIITAVGEKK